MLIFKFISKIAKSVLCIFDIYRISCDISELIIYTLEVFSNMKFADAI
jgi:hypothetical protein